MKPRHILLALLVVVAWGFNFVAIHVGLDGIPPLLFAAIRFSAICLLLPVVPRPPVPWRNLAAVGLLMSAGQFGFLYSAMAAGLSSGLASLILQAQVLFTVGFAGLLLGERLKRIQASGIAVAVAGLGIVAVARGGSLPPLGLALCLAAAASWGAGNVAARTCQGASGLSLTVWGSLFVPVPLLLGSLVIDGPHGIAEGLAHFGTAAVLSTAYTVLLASLFGYTAWNTLLGLYPAGSVAPFTLLVPVIGLMAGWIFLGEQPPALALVGGAVLLAGVATIVLGPRVAASRQRPAGPATP